MMEPPAISFKPFIQLAKIVPVVDKEGIINRFIDCLPVEAKISLLWFEGERAARKVAEVLLNAK